jgi:Outer membrane protein beta-barrel domain
MKKIILSAVVPLFFITPVLYAQKARIGLSGGATLAQVRTKVDNTKDNSGYHFGFTLGVMADIALGKQFSFQPALNFLQKGGREKREESGTTFTYNATLNYFELPLNFIYHGKGEKGHFIAGIGPSLAYGISGQSKISSNGQSSTETIHFGNSKSNGIKPFEFGGNLLAGYETNTGISVTFNFNMGFNNLYNDGIAEFRNNYFGLRLGYFIRGKK